MSTSDAKNENGDEKNVDEMPPLPPHWIFDGEPDSPNYTGSLMQKVVSALYRILCVVTFGEKSLRPIWERRFMADSGAWERGREMLRERIEHTNIVVRSLGFIAGECFVFRFFIGRFAPHDDRGFLYDGSTEELPVLSVR